MLGILGGGVIIKAMRLKSGFTMVEVLIVIGIIAILTAIALPSISNIRAKNRDTERVADIAALQLALSLYYNQHTSGYPVDLATLESTGYTTVDSITDPLGEEYLYVPLARSGADKCVSYHLGVGLELPTAQIDPANTFSSIENVSGETPSGHEHCIGYSGVGFDGSYATNPLIYNVHP